LIGWGGVLLGAEAMGLPTDDIEAAIRAIDWEALVLPNGTISHGYGDTGGDASPFGWDVFGGEALWVAMFYAASTGRLPEIPLADPTDPKTSRTGRSDSLRCLRCGRVHSSGGRFGDVHCAGCPSALRGNGRFIRP
jgi:hypothetical protein